MTTPETVMPVVDNYGGTIRQASCSEIDGLDEPGIYTITEDPNELDADATRNVAKEGEENLDEEALEDEEDLDEEDEDEDDEEDDDDEAVDDEDDEDDEEVLDDENEEDEDVEEEST